MILSVSSSSGFVTCALLLNGKILSSKCINEEKIRGDRIDQVIEMLLKHYSLSIDDIKRVICNIGPGSFHGIKSSLAYVLGFTILGDTEVQALTSFDILSASLLYKLSLPDLDQHHLDSDSVDIDAIQKTLMNQSSWEKLLGSMLVIRRTNTSMYCRKFDLKNSKFNDSIVERADLSHLKNNSNQIIYSEDCDQLSNSDESNVFTIDAKSVMISGLMFDNKNRALCVNNMPKFAFAFPKIDLDKTKNVEPYYLANPSIGKKKYN